MKLSQSPVILVALVAGLFIWSGPLCGGEAAVESRDAVDYLQHVAELEEGEMVWGLGRSLSALGREAIPALLEAVESDSAAVRLTAGYALLRLGEQRRGVAGLQGLIRSPAFPLERRIEGLAALGVEGGEEAAQVLRDVLADKSVGPILQVEAAKGLWRLNRGEVANQALRSLLKSSSPRARSEAALALAAFAPTREMVKLLRQLAFEPGRSGRRARELLTRRARMALVEGCFSDVAPILRELAEYPALDLGAAEGLLEVSGWAGVDRNGTEDRYARELLAEIIMKIHTYYPVDLSGSPEEQERERERLSARKLADAAARALVEQVDPFSTYLDEADLSDVTERMEGEYGGIGAWVGMRTIGGEERFTILLPMYGQPAHEAGLKAMDWVEMIDGEPIDGLDLRAIIKRLKGRPGSKVRLSVWRRNWPEPQEFALTRREIKVPSVKARMLPDKIGYIRLEIFGDEQTAKDLQRALRRLKREGMRALVLDLSSNPGGMLQTAVEVSDLFLSKGKLIVSVHSKDDPEVKLRVHERQEYHARTMGDTGFPMAVMVNGNSASASEIVAGALRDHKRAVLVGTRTFGKGSVQSLFDIRATGGRSRLKLTIAKYYLPSGVCIAKRGIEPDVLAEPRTLGPERIRNRLRLRDSLLLLDYVREQFASHEELLRTLFRFDAGELKRYPAIEALQEKLVAMGFELEDDDLREEVRRALMTYLESERGEELFIDPEGNLSLAYAVLELRKRLAAADEAVPPLYAWYAQRVEAIEAERARAAKYGVRAEE